jgi:hypothetical protein
MEATMAEAIAIVVLLAAILVASRAIQNPGDLLSVRLTFPRSLTTEQAISAVRALAGLRPPWWRRVFGAPSVSIEVRANAIGLEHMVAMPKTRSEYVLGAIRAAIPGVRVSDAGGQSPPPGGLVRELRLAGTGRLRTDVPTAAAGGILAALHPLGPDEQAAVQYVITPAARSVLVWLADLIAVIRGVEPSEPRSVEPLFAVGLRVAATARSAARRRQLMARLLGAFHALNSPDTHLTRRILPSVLVAARLRRDAPGTTLLDAEELAACLGLPLEAPALPGLTLAGSRELPATASVPRRGLVLGDSTVAGSTRPVAIAGAEARRGLHICAPTGAGKSTALTNLAVQLMEAKDRPGLICIDSKGDLIADLADRIPPTRRDDVLVFDPADRIAPVGFNVIGGSGEAGLIVDHVVADLRARYGAAGLGPRSEDVLRAALTTLTTHSGQYTLCEVEPLLTNPAFRQKLIGTLDDPVLQSFWAWFGSLSDAARGEVIAPLANKIRTFTLRRQVRAVIGQRDGLDLANALERGGIILASLAKGTVGADAAGLIGAAMTSRLWTAIQARASVPIASRRPATVICDEFQDFAAISPIFPDVVSQSRGYAVSWVLAHQHLAQLDRATREAVLANCRSRLVMQTTASDARAFAREFHPYLDPDDLQGLGAYEGFAAVSTGASVAPPASIRTRPAPASLDCGDAVRTASRTRYGTPPAEVDAAIRARVAKARSTAPVGGARRES